MSAPLCKCGRRTLTRKGRGVPPGVCWLCFRARRRSYLREFLSRRPEPVKASPSTPKPRPVKSSRPKPAPQPKPAAERFHPTNPAAAALWRQVLAGRRA